MRVKEQWELELEGEMVQWEFKPLGRYVNAGDAAQSWERRGKYSGFSLPPDLQSSANNLPLAKLSQKPVGKETWEASFAWGIPFPLPYRAEQGKEGNESANSQVMGQYSC